MRLHERDCGDQRLWHPVPYFRREAHDYRNHEGQAELQDQFPSGTHSFLVVFVNLYIVVGESYAAAPDRGDELEYGVDAVQPAYQECAHQHGKDDDDPAHRGGAFLLHLAFEAEVADFFSYLMPAEHGYYLLPYEECYEHAYYGGEHGPERQVAEQSHARNTQAIKPFCKMVQHLSYVFEGFFHNFALVEVVLLRSYYLVCLMTLSG